VVAVLIFGYSLLTEWEAILILPEWAKPEKWPKLPWPYAVAALAIAAVFIMLEGGSRWHKETLDAAAIKEKSIICEYEKKISDEIAKRKSPKIVVRCDWNGRIPGRERMNPFGVEEHDLILVMLSEVPALNVSIKTISSNAGSARFETIRIVRETQPIACTIEFSSERGPVFMHDLQYFIRTSFKDEISLLQTESPPIPIVVTYEDADGGAWESVNELVYEFFGDRADVRPVEIRPLARPVVPSIPCTQDSHSESA
jgi:hypothetical protein